jgi:hypothetical protein
MAKQRTDRIPWQCLGNVWIVGLTWTLMAVLCPGKAAAAAGSPSSLSAASATLEYQETDYSVNTWSVISGAQTKPFKKEPAGLSGKISRGTLNFSAGSSNSIPFLWARDARKLYLDLNGDGDLFQDTSKMFSTDTAASANSQTFKHVRLLLHTIFGNCWMQLTLNFYDYGQANGPMCTVEAHSFWQGKLSLQGRDWQAGIVPSALAQAGVLANGWLLLRPWENRNQPFSATDRNLATVPLARKLFMDGHAYQLDWSGEPGKGMVSPVLQFAEQSAALGELTITGQFIGRLVLQGGRNVLAGGKNTLANEQYVVVLDQPAGTVKIPTGSYNQVEVRLEKNGALAYLDSGPAQNGRQISVNDKTPAVLDVGGPLTNSVTANRHGQDLVMNYQLLGAGGEIYQMPAQDRSKPPKFAVYSGEKKIASGEFEYG